jgi:transglutaminase-like putative cysteine protease
VGSEARARVGLWFLLTIALFSFNQLFATGDYPGPAILGMLIATGIAVGCRRLGLGASLTFLASTVVLTAYLSLVFQAPRTLWGLPTPGSIQGLVDSVQRAVDHSQVDFAPVPLRPGYAVLIVAALWVATTIGEVATFRWRRPLLASLFPLVLFSVALTTGTGTAAPALVAIFLAALLTYWGLESSHRLRSWGRWVSAWSHQRDTEPDSLTGDLARRLGAAAIMCAVISPLFLPAIEDGIFSWRSGIGDGPGGGSGGTRLNPWVSIIPGLPTQTDAELFQVKTGNDDYWRVASLERFDGANWHEAERERVPAEAGAIGGPAAPIASTRELVQEITITGLEGEFLPAALAPIEVRRTGVDDAAAVAGIDYDPDSSAILLDDDLQEGDTFTVRSNVPDLEFEELLNSSLPGPGQFDDVYFELPQAFDPEAIEMIERWTRGADTPFQELVAIQERLREFDYTLEPNLPSGNYVSSFLLDVREGFCQQFATAFAVIARELGYPSRVSVGFLTGSRDVGNETYSVRGTDAHAWPEVYFDAYGWVRFEPTPRGESFTPDYTLEPADPQNGGEGPSFQNPFSDSEEGGPGRGGEAISEVGGGEGRVEVDPGVAQGEEGAGAGARGTPQWQKTFARLTLFVGFCLLIFLAFVPLIKEMRIRKRYTEASGPDGIAAAAFVQFTEEAAELAEPRRPSESALAYCIRMATAKRVADRTALRLAEIYEAAAYGSEDITPELAEEARRLARALRTQLWHQATWWSRAVRLFSPRRLAV